MNFDNFTTKSKEAIQRCVVLAASKSQLSIEPGHILQAILDIENDITEFLFINLNIDEKGLKKDIQKLVESYPKAFGGQTFFSTDSQDVLQKSLESLKEFNDNYITIEHFLLALLDKKGDVGDIMKKYGFEKSILKKAIKDLRGNKRATSRNSESNYKSLEKYTINLNELARQGGIDPVIGRDEEIRRVLQIISRRRKNNPILLGEPGVGKTAIAEGIAQRIIDGDVPESILSKTILSLDLGLVMAGAKFQGEFEERLKSVIKEVRDSDGEIILFIDEIHALVGTGANKEGSMDAANMLKPELARGNLRAIGATTFKEYQKYIEKDKALERRFQPVKINEPSIEDAISILRGIKDRYELHHGVRIKDAAIIEAVKLSQRYISDRFLPDKAIDVMDEAAAKIRIDIDSMPEELDELTRKITQLEIEKEAIKKENDTEKDDELNKTISLLNEDKTKLKTKWQKEKEIIGGIKKQKAKIDQLKIKAEQAERDFDYGKVAELRYGKIAEAEKKLKQLNNKADKLKNNNPLLKEEVDAEEIAEVIAKWTGIPIKNLLQTEKEQLLKLEEILTKRVSGQPSAIKSVANAIRRSRVGLQDPNKPIGSFMFLGSTGVGKTELSKALAEAIFNDESSLVRIDMSEYQEKHSVSRLIGAPPGYVGYDEGGQLTEAIRRNPYSVVLLDEIEKAHSDVFNILLQVLDDGRLTDSKGRTVNFKNTIIIMTTNIGTEIIQEKLSEIKTTKERNEIEIIENTKDEIFEVVKKSFRPEFLNRVDEIIMFKPLSSQVIKTIAQLQLEGIKKRLVSQGIDIKFDENIIDKLATEGYSPQFGARPMKRLIQRLILDKLATILISNDINKEKPIQISHDKNNKVLIKNI